MRLLRGASEGLLDLLFPRRCVGCGSPGAWMCASCEHDVHWMAPPFCASCGREAPRTAPPTFRCQDCARELPRIDGIRAAARYEGAIRSAVHRLKYDGRRAMAGQLAAYLVRAAAELPGEAVVPLPLHPNRLRVRGYNQSELLARELASRLGLPLLLAAERVRETEDQIGKNRRQRQQNVKGAFVCADRSLVAGRALLLVDDVCTTGSTLFACAEPLLKAGAASVWGLAVARQDSGRL
ncbi:MAG: ComF family protein [Chloroflexi bacterium]|nr:ComF family protein [Chloroflexota bacterium]